MPYRNILVYLDQGQTNSERIESAVAIAKFQEATLNGVAVSALPDSGLLQKLGVANSDEVAGKARAEAEATISAFLEVANAAGVATESTLIECGESDAPEKLSRLARVHDLCVVRQGNPDSDNTKFVAALSEEVMLSSGRPVIFMPYVGAHEIPFKKGLIAWDGSAAATRAVHDALPLLKTMEEAVILVVENGKVERSADAEPGERLSRHLSAHGVKNAVLRSPKGDLSTSSVILNDLANTGADLLIMGGYGTPKLREVILGGVTRTVLDSMTVPVLMSH